LLIADKFLNGTGMGAVSIGSTYLFLDGKDELARRNLYLIT